MAGINGERLELDIKDYRGERWKNYVTEKAVTRSIIKY